MAKRQALAEKRPRELLRLDLRERYRHELFGSWEGRDLSAQHRFVPAADKDHVRMSFTIGRPHKQSADLVIESSDGGANWYRISGWHPPQDRGVFEWGWLRMALYRAGLEAWISQDYGQNWVWRAVPHAAQQQYDNLGAPNCFSAIMLRRGLFAGRIVMVSTYFTGLEGPDCELAGATYSDDWGGSWHCSRLFAPPYPLAHVAEGFGEPAVAEMPNGWLWMVFRTEYGELWQAPSHDGGETWGPPTPTGFASPIANCYAAQEPKTGATVLCWNLTRPGTDPEHKGRRSLYHPRRNLVFAVSHDNTQTWTVPVVVEAGEGQYPTIHFAAGRMFIMYQKALQDKPHRWDSMGLELVAYDTAEVLALPAWTLETIQPFIAQGLIAHWRASPCYAPGRETIT